MSRIKITLSILSLFAVISLSAQIDYLVEQELIERSCSFGSKQDLKKKIHLLDSLGQYEIIPGDGEELYLYDQGMTYYKAGAIFKDDKYSRKAIEYFMECWTKYKKPQALWNIALQESFLGNHRSSIDKLDLYLETFKDSLEIDYEEVFSLHAMNSKALLEACEAK